MATAIFDMDADHLAEIKRDMEKRSGSEYPEMTICPCFSGAKADSPNVQAIMFLIGALADHGEDRLTHFTL